MGQHPGGEGPRLEGGVVGLARAVEMVVEPEGVEPRRLGGPGPLDDLGVVQGDLGEVDADLGGGPPTPLPAGRGVAGHLRQDLGGEPLEAVDGVLGAAPRLHQGPPHAGVGPAGAGRRRWRRPTPRVTSTSWAALLWPATRPGGPPWPPRDLLGGVVHRDPAVAERARRGPSAAGPSPPMCRGGQGRVHRLGLEHDRAEVEELPVVLDHLLAPQPPADPDGLVHAAAPGGEVEADRLPLGLQPAGPDTELDPALRDPRRGWSRPATPRRDGGVRCCRPGSRSGSSRSCPPGSPVREDVVDRHVRGDGGRPPPRRGCRPSPPG